jgi:hypothetical protein
MQKLTLAEFVAWSILVATGHATFTPRRKQRQPRIVQQPKQFKDPNTVAWTVEAQVMARDARIGR